MNSPIGPTSSAVSVPGALRYVDGRRRDLFRSISGAFQPAVAGAEAVRADDVAARFRVLALYREDDVRRFHVHEVRALAAGEPVLLEHCAKSAVVKDVFPAVKKSADHIGRLLSYAE